jgi:hexosaminidase
LPGTHATARAFPGNKSNMKIILAILFVIGLSVCLYSQTTEINIVPRPNSIKLGSGSFVISTSTKIVATDAETRRSADSLNALLETYLGKKLKITSKAPKANYIEMMPPGIMAHGEMPRGAMIYALAIEPTRIRIQGFEPARFYAIQTIAQMLPADRSAGATIPVGKIFDGPRFPYRGMHLDVSRHFFPVEFVKKYIDLMAQYKFNYFHWHLTDDQGWRIEIKKYPKLTEVGSKRPETVKERNLQPYIGDGVPVEGFYTQEQIKDVVAYAKARYITVIPEIELPGHSSAALAAYPEFGCKTDYKYKVQTTWGIFKEVYCPTDATFKFLEDVLSETIDLFPDSPFIHIGGDEVLKDHWKESAFVQELKQKENLKDEHEVQSYFVRRIEKFINSKGKKIIGWDEILEGGVAPNATIMSWRGEKGGIEAARAKHDVIMTPNTYVYFDYGQGDPAYEPLNIGSYVPLSKVYGWDPVPKELVDDEAKFILGGQANVWTEYLKTPQAVEYMAFPRMLALAEVLWSQPENKNYADFLRRLGDQLARLDKLNVNYRIPEPAGLENRIVDASGKATIELQPFVAGAKIYYTLDGSTPTTASALYDQPITLALTDGETRTLKTVTVLPNGRASSVYAAVFVRRDPVPAVDGPSGEKKQGVVWELFTPNENLPSEGVRVRGESRSIQFAQFEKLTDLKKPFVATFDGYLNVPADGIYEFQVDATWDTTIVLDGKMIIDDAGTKDRRVRSAIVPLKAGMHQLSMRYDHRGGDAVFRFLYGLKGQGLNRLYGGEFVH